MSPGLQLLMWCRRARCSGEVKKWAWEGSQRTWGKKGRGGGLRGATGVKNWACEGSQRTWGKKGEGGGGGLHECNVLIFINYNR